MATGTIERPYAGNSALMALGQAYSAIPNSADLNAYVTPGVFGVRTDEIAASLSNCPSIYGGTLRVWNSLGTDNGPGDAWYYATQEYIDYRCRIWIRYGNTDSNRVMKWNSWIQICSDTVSTGALTAAGGWTIDADSWLKKCGRLVSFYISVSGGTFTSGWNTLAAVPAGYRPSNSFNVIGINNGSTSLASISAKFQVLSSGIIGVYNMTGLTNNLRLYATFVAA